MRLKPLPFVVCLLQAALLLAVSLRASPAEACSQPPVPRTYYTLAESIPGDGASNVPLDGVLLFTSRGWELEGIFEDAHTGVHDVLTVTVTDLDTGELVPGQLRSWWRTPSGEVWRPYAPLLPNRSYSFAAVLQQSDSRPEQAQGPTELHGTFSTGEQLSPPLEFLGELDVELESFEQDKYHCDPGMCSCDNKVGREVATRARIRVPGVQGGSPIGSYDFDIWVTDNTPYRFDVPAQEQRREHKVMNSWGAQSAGEPVETLFVFHGGYDFSYKPCFAWRAVDPAGRTLEGAPICPKEKVHPRGFAFGCSVTPGAEGTAFLVLLGALLTVWRVRRRPMA
ncbi:hypothetical protein ACN28E_27380 [Archangium lansingense]|uniref:hypothetical protein n=1 Tax=Archangium lansingense TaxID=2995310 RepID=UPI003B7CD026